MKTHKNIRPFQALFFSFLLGSSIFFTSCNLFNPEPPDYKAIPWFKDGVITDIYSNTDAVNLDVNNFLYSGMLDLYLWSNRVPKKLVPTLTNFPLPDSLLERTIVKPDDRFTFIEKNGQAYLDQLQNGSVANPLFGFGAAFPSAGNLRVARVLVPSPAYLAGLRRGMRIITIDGKPAPVTAEEYVKASETWGNTLTFEVEDTAKVRRAITMMRGFFTQQVLPVTKVFSVAGKRVGYIQLSSYTGNVQSELNTAFSTLSQQNVQEIVVDLRNNGGGFVSAAGQMCGLIAGQLAGTAYVQYTYNTTYKANNRTANISSYPQSLRLTRAFFLVNSGTASASELTINALKPFIDVVIIGTPTVGKAVGSNIVFHQKSGYVMQPISFKFANARGEADFLNGFTPTRTIQDPVDRDFGDPEEMYLKAALQFIQTGSFPAAVVKNRDAFVQNENMKFIEEHGMRDFLPALAPFLRK